MIPPDAEAIEAFSVWIAQRLGLHFEPEKEGFLADILRQRISAGRFGNAREYLISIGSGRSRGEIGMLAEALTVTETYFFRNENHFRALLETALPARISARSPNPGLRLLSAGCASGEEAYSLAMTIRHFFPAMDPRNVEIRAMDINPAMLAKAESGRYTAWALRDTPDWARESHFVKEGKEFRLSEDIRRMVSFEERNLSGANDDLWERDAFDIIFFRNVLMYFVPEVAARVVSRMAAALSPGGYLFLGHAENLRGLSNDFHLCHSHGSFYYQKLDRPGAVPLPRASGSAGLAPPRLPPDEPSGTWVDTIRMASEKIADLEARSRRGPDPVPEGFPSIAWDLGFTLDLMRRERFSEAMETLQRLPEESSRDPDAMLLRAVLLTNMGRLPEAEKVCARLLASGELNAGAHYLMALCREHAGDPEAAEEHDAAAIHLDPSFAMPWLHKGLLSKKGGRPGESSIQLEHALVLLAKEEPSRILFFGGGFGREALIQLCRSEIGIPGEPE